MLKENEMIFWYVTAKDSSDDTPCIRDIGFAKSKPKFDAHVSEIKASKKWQGYTFLEDNSKNEVLTNQACIISDVMSEEDAEVFSDIFNLMELQGETE